MRGFTLEKQIKVVSVTILIQFFVLVKLRMDQKLELNPLKGGFSAKPDTPPSLSWKVPHEFSLKGFGFWQAKPPAHPEKKGPFEMAGTHVGQ